MSMYPATTSDPIKVALVGATGKMGQYASAAIKSSDDLELVAELASQDSLDNILSSEATHVLDLTVPTVSPQIVEFAIENSLSTLR